MKTSTRSVSPKAWRNTIGLLAEGILLALIVIVYHVAYGILILLRAPVTIPACIAQDIRALAQREQGRINKGDEK